MKTSLEGRARRKQRIRKKISGTTERPRLTVFKSAKHMYAQVVDDIKGVTLLAVSTSAKAAQGELKDANKTDAAKVIGKKVAEACKAKGIQKVVFDRNGYMFHGRVKAVADSAREGGLEF